MLQNPHPLQEEGEEEEEEAENVDHRRKKITSSCLNRVSQLSDHEISRVKTSKMKKKNGGEIGEEERRRKNRRRKKKK